MGEAEGERERKERGKGGLGGRGVCEGAAGERERACRYHSSCKKNFIHIASKKILINFINTAKEQE